ncbi:unnamed protein product [Toxocara canis]|uniref:PINc domain-containing protein n=1 Tax=Toxocara canis TaxID=6265 RepID=A0A183UB22_TOXCA|nr:unnamed protein product [Toxocara canis]
MSEFPPTGEGGTEEIKKKSRPPVQLYRPGMMKGVDITKNASRHTQKTRPPKLEPTAETGYGPKRDDEFKVVSGSSGRRGNNYRGRGRGRGRGKGTDSGEADRRSEVGSLCSSDDVRSEGEFSKKRGGRRRSSGGSSTSSTYRHESSSTVSSRKNSRDNSAGGDGRSAIRRSNQRFLNNVKGFHSSSQSLFDRPPSSMHYQNYTVGEERNWRLGSKGPSKQPQSARNQPSSTYQEKDFQRTNRYSSYREPRRNAANNNTLPPRRGDAFSSATDVNSMVFENSDIYGFRKLGHGNWREESGRQRRNWSFRSNRSERYDNRTRTTRSDVGSERGDEDYYDDEELEGDRGEKSIDNRPASPAQYKSFQDLCASFDSISFNWSTEVEEEERRKKEREERTRVETEGRLSAKTSNAAVGVDSASGRWQTGRKAERGGGGAGDRRRRSDRDHRRSPRGFDSTGGHRNMRYSQRTQHRHRNDSFTSQTSSVAESIEERSDDECASGERTPTYEQGETCEVKRRMSDLCETQAGSHMETTTATSVELRPQSTTGNECERSEVSRPHALGWKRSSNMARRGRFENGYEHVLRRGQNKRGEAVFNDSEVSEAMDSVATPLADVPVAIPSGQPPHPPPPVAMVAPFSRLPPPSGVFMIDVSVPPPNLSIPPPNVSVLPPPIRLLGARPATPSNIPPPPSAGTGVVWRKERGRKMDVPPTEWPIHMEISKHEGPLIQNLNDAMAVVIQKIAESGDLAAGEELLTVSASLAEVFLSIVTRDIDYTYAMNLEQHMWKQCFYKPIEALRSVSNSLQQNAHLFRSLLTQFIQQGLDFYIGLLNNKYEVTFGFLIDEFLYWPAALPGDDFMACARVGCGAHEADDRSLKVAVLSAQRLAVSIGDLHRYNAVVRGVKDYSAARLWYLRGAQLGPANGRSYNQLALLALYAIIQRAPMRSARDAAFARIPSFIRANKCKLQGKWVDVMFYYTRALAAHYAFETARQPLFTAFNDMRKKIAEYETQLDERLGVGTSQAEAERDAIRAEKPHEVWITPDGQRTEREQNDLLECSVTHAFDNDSIVKLYRRTVPYLLHTAGLLITKIGMEMFERQSERALLQLMVLLSNDECPLSAIQLVQISALFLFAVHNSSSISVEANTCSLLQQRAVQIVLSIFGILLRSMEECSGHISSILDGTKPVPSKMRRVLPSLWVLSEWLSTPSVNRLYKGMPSLGPIESSLIQVDVWQALASVANALVDAETNGKLARSVSEASGNDDQRIEIVLPESVFLASFVDVFPVTPKSIRLCRPSAVQLAHDGVMLALHARTSAILSAAEYLDGTGLHCFAFDERLHRFVATQTSSSCERSEPQPILPSRHISASFNTGGDTKVTEEPSDQERERIVIEVRPNYVVPDTNTFIDHLESVVRIVSNGKFTVLVPTTVASELTSLSRPAAGRPGMGQLADEEQENWVVERAKLAVSYLQKAAEEKIPHISTVTSKGSRLPSVFFASEQCTVSQEDKTVNDDMILSSCSALSATMPPPSSCDSSDGRTKLYRGVVLLTDDRALSIKAMCANIPCRTIPSFIKWAAIQ